MRMRFEDMDTFVSLLRFEDGYLCEPIRLENVNLWEPMRFEDGYLCEPMRFEYGYLCEPYNSDFFGWPRMLRDAYLCENVN